MKTEEWVRKRMRALDYQLSQDAFDDTSKSYTRKDVEEARYYMLLEVLEESVKEE